MNYLVDTNVISELARSAPAPEVVAWFGKVEDDALHLSVLTLGELRRGVEKLPSGKRKEKLRDWLEQELPDWFGERLLPVDADVADTWGHLQARSGKTLPGVGSLLAATALHHRLCMVTRNVRDFQVAGLDVVDPWSDQNG